MLRKRKTKRVLSRKGGMSGITAKEGMDPGKAINFFLEHSTIEYLSKGSNGITLVATLHPNTVSPYKSTDVDTYGQDVAHILLKLVLFRDAFTTSKRAEFGFEYKEERQTIKLRFTEENEFQKEIIRQKEVYEKTRDYLEPICPAIVFSNVYGGAKKSGVLNKILSNCLVSDGTHAMLNSIRLLSHMYGSVGIIAMEFADNYSTLHDLRKPHFTYKRDNIGLYLILELALKTGYSHADFHGSNIMMKQIPEGGYPYFLNGPPIKPLFIDFGLSVKIPRVKYEQIQQLCNDGKYVEALAVLCTVPRRDGMRLNTTHAERLYGWACKPENAKTTNRVVAELFQQREEAKQYLLDNPQPAWPKLPIRDTTTVVVPTGEEDTQDTNNLLDLIELQDEMPRKSLTRKRIVRKDKPETSEYSREIHSLSSPRFSPRFL